MNNVIMLVITFISVGLLMALEHFLCTKFENPLLGGIIPCLMLIFTIYVFASGTIPLNWRNAFPFMVLNLLYFGDWDSGRRKHKEIKEAELNKMKAKDI